MNKPSIANMNARRKLGSLGSKNSTTAGNKNSTMAANTTSLTEHTNKIVFLHRCSKKSSLNCDQKLTIRKEYQPHNRAERKKVKSQNLNNLTIF